MTLRCRPAPREVARARTTVSVASFVAALRLPAASTGPHGLVQVVIPTGMPLVPTNQADQASPHSSHPLGTQR